MFWWDLEILKSSQRSLANVQKDRELSLVEHPKATLCVPIGWQDVVVSTLVEKDQVDLWCCL